MARLAGDRLLPRRVNVRTTGSINGAGSRELGFPHTASTSTASALKGDS